MTLFTNFNPKEITFNDGLGDISIEELSPYQWKLLHSISYTTSDGIKVTVPAGFITDGASSPFRLLITTWGGHYSTAAIFHDWFYQNINQGHPDPGALTRLSADNRLDEIMRKCKVDSLVRFSMWTAVRLFGGKMFRSLGVR